MLDGVDIENFIRNHDNKYDFMMRTKVPRSSRLVLIDNDGNEAQQQNICRYYASVNGGKLVKIMPPLTPEAEPRRIGIDTEWMLRTCNNMIDFADDIDYDYYVEAAKKLLIGNNMAVDNENVAFL